MTQSLGKACMICNVLKPLAEYYRAPHLKCGYLNKCKSCCRRYSTNYRSRNLKKCLEYDRARANDPDRILLREAYRQTSRGAEALRKGKSRWAKKNSIKINAQRALRQALIKGIVKRENCGVCGARAEAHHPDYTKPLSVVWLCSKHHAEEHVRIRRKKKSLYLTKEAL